MTENEQKQDSDDLEEAVQAEATTAESVTVDDAALAPEEQIAALEAEVAAQKDQYMRQLAETQNIQRRHAREREDMARYGASALAKDLLNVADNLERALQALPAETREADEAVKNLAVGIEMTQKELMSALERQGVQKITPLGEPFNYEHHQAMFEVPNSGQPAGTVVEVMQAGYVMHDRLLRPAMVGVAKGEAEGVEHVDTTA